MTEAWQDAFDDCLSVSKSAASIDPLDGLPNSKGIVLFADAHRRPVQLVQTAAIRSFVKKRLSYPPSGDAATTTRASIELVFFKKTQTYIETHLFYQRLCHLVFGDRWQDWLKLPEPFFASLDAAKPCACFCVNGGAVWKNSKSIFGLFETRRDAETFCRCMNELFGLCLDRSAIARNARCSYGQIGACDRPCLNRDAGVYQDRIQQALSFLSGNKRCVIAEWIEQMKAASQKMDFEAAQQWKKKLEKSHLLETAQFRWVKPMADWAVLHIDKIGGKKNLAQFWRLDSQSAWLLGQATINDIGAVKSLIASAFEKTGDAFEYAMTHLEHLATIHYLLFRQNRRGLWYLLNGDRPSLSDVTEGLTAFFAKKDPDDAPSTGS